MTAAGRPCSCLELVESFDNFGGAEIGVDLYRLSYPEMTVPHGIMQKSIVQKIQMGSFALIDNKGKFVTLLPRPQLSQVSLTIT